MLFGHSISALLSDQVNEVLQLALQYTQVSHPIQSPDTFIFALFFLTLFFDEILLC